MEPLLRNLNDISLKQQYSITGYKNMIYMSLLALSPLLLIKFRNETVLINWLTAVVNSCSEGKPHAASVSSYFIYIRFFIYIPEKLLVRHWISPGFVSLAFVDLFTFESTGGTETESAFIYCTDNIIQMAGASKRFEN